MSSLTTASAELNLAWMLTTGTAVRPTAWYVALHTEDPTVSGSVGEVTVGTDADYVRKSITFADPASMQCQNNSAVSWTAASDATTHTVTHLTVWTALTGGVCLHRGPLLAVRSRVASGVLTFNIGEIVIAGS